MHIPVERKKWVWFYFGKYFTNRTVLTKPLPQNISHDERFSMHSWQQSILTGNLHPVTCDTEESCSVLEILLGLWISEKEPRTYHIKSYQRTLIMGYIWYDNKLFFVNNYVDIGLSTWEASIDIKLVFNQ